MGESVKQPIIHQAGEWGMQAVTFLGLLPGIGLAIYLKPDGATAMAIALAFLVGGWVVHGAASLLVQNRRRGAEPDGNTLNWPRIGTKIVGLCGLLGLVVIACSIFPFFAHSSAVAWLKSLGTSGLLPAVVVLAPLGTAYLALTDRLASDPEDYLYHVGRAILLKDYDDKAVMLALRVLAIKSFFLVLMFSGGMTAFADFTRSPFWQQPIFSAAWFQGAVAFVYLLDVVLAAGGYISTFKLFGWHVRATETTALGWVACLICYEPFFPAFYQAFVPYSQGPDAGYLMPEGSMFFLSWNLAILFFHGIYVWATLALGPRFSNLTHRGIVTAGPYRFVRHPAYLAKNIAWWMTSLPLFVASGWTHGMARAAMLAIISFIYYQRAMAEERMLSLDPAYRDYAARVPAAGRITVR